MEGKDKKKESIDEILSDLNGLLNRMPSILDGIKMPQLQPAEPPRPQPEPQREEAPPPAGNEADKTVVLQPFSGLQEGAPEPAPAEAPETEVSAQEPAADAARQPAAVELPAENEADKTVVLPPFSGLPEGAPQPEAAAADRPEVQSLGDFMFGAGAPAGEAAPAQEAAAAPEAAPAAEPEPAAPAVQPQPSLPAYDSTKDFGIPDIDALLQMSEGAAAPAAAPEPAPQSEPLPEAGVIPGAVQAAEQQTDLAASMQAATEESSVENKDQQEGQPAPGEAGQERQPEAFSAFDAFAIDAGQEAAQPQGEMPRAEAGAETLRLEPQAEMPQAEAGAETLNLEPQGEMPQAEAGAETLNLEPQGEMPQAEAGAETLRLEPQAEMPQAEAGAETLNLEPQALQAEAGTETLNLEPQGEIQPATEAPAVEAAVPQFGELPGIEIPVSALSSAAASEEPKLEIGKPEGIELSPAANLGAAGPAGAEETLPGGGGLELSVGRPGGGGLELGGGQSGDATLVVEPHSSGASGDEEKTVIFQAPPSNTSRAQAGDLDGLAAKQPPEGIPPERVRSLMFVYSMEDKALCATVLSELDAICLKSPAKPMFVKRAAVKECDPDVNPNFLQQSAAECGAQGLICLGNVPGDKVSEIEGVFSSGGGFFRYYDSSSFNHSAALDLVMDLIVR